MCRRKGSADLTGKRVALVGGYSYGGVIDTAGPVLVRSQSEEDSLARLLKGEVDYTLMDELVVEYIQRNHPQESAKRLQIGVTSLITRELFLAVRRALPDAESIVSRFNAQLRDMIADRTYHRLLHVDWIQADINGDGVPENVPRTDQTGPKAPTHSYALFRRSSRSPRSRRQARTASMSAARSTATGPACLPGTNPASRRDPDPGRSTASIFRFTW